MTPKPLPLDEARLSIEDGDTRIDRTILGAGTRVLTQEIPATKSAGVSLWVPVGSRDEGPRTAGSTHFLEHLLFKGTNKRSALDIAVAFDSVGGESNAETAREHTAYWARVRDADLDMAIETLTDMVTDSRLDEDEFSMERGVILDELAMGEDSPTDTVHDAFQLAVHGDRPIGCPVGGTAPAIREGERAGLLFPVCLFVRCRSKSVASASFGGLFIYFVVSTNTYDNNQHLVVFTHQGVDNSDSCL